MNQVIGYAKAHWYYFAAGLFGLFVLYELVKAMQGGGQPAASSDVSGGAAGIQALTAAADLTNAQVNGSTTIAEYAAGVQNNQTVASLQLGEVQTAAQLDATNHQTQATIDIAKINADAGVSTAQIVTNGQVAQTQIEGATLDTLGAQRADVQKTQINTVNSQIEQILQHSKHASQDLTSFAPIVAEETGQGSTAGALAGANAASRVAGSQIATTAIQTGGQVVSQVAGSLLSGLFA